MKRGAVAVVALVAGMVVAAGFGMALDAPSASPSTTTTAERSPVEAPAGDPLVVVWTPGGLPPGFADAVAAHPGVEATTVVLGDAAHLLSSVSADGVPVDEPPPGMVIPLDALAVDPEGFAALVPKSSAGVVAALDERSVLLGETSARLRRLSPGGVVELGGGERFEVAGVVDDGLVGGAEIVMSLAGGRAAGVTTERYVLARLSVGAGVGEQRLRQALAPFSVPLRIRGPGETPYLRHGDAVLPQALVKERFGEFAYRPGVGGFTLDPSWERAHLVTVELPVVGRVRCHRLLVPALEGAFGELEERNLSSLVDPEGFAGCWNPRTVAGSEVISRHAWGAAVDVNAGKNPTGLGSVQDPRLVETMARWGFTWGGDWLIPDPAHFEYVGPPHA